MSNNIHKLPPSKNFPKGRYKARYRDARGSTYSKTFATKRQAEMFIARVSTDKQRGDFINPGRAAIRFADVAETWRLTLTRNRKEKTILGYEHALRKHVLPALGNLRVGDVTYGRLEAFVSDLGGNLAPASVRGVFKVVKLILDHAVRDGRIRMNPARKVPLPRPDSREMVFLTAEQVEAVAAEITPPYGILIRFAAYTGLRPGEIAALRVKDIDLRARTVRVRATLADLSGKLVETEPKTRAARRTVTMPRFVLMELRGYLGERALQPEAFVFTGERGGPVRMGNFRRRHFRPAVECSLPPHLHRLRLHDLRHTYASLLVAQGAHPKEMAELMGHSSVMITLDRYSHVMPHLGAALADRLEAAYGVVRSLDDTPRTASSGTS